MTPRTPRMVRWSLSAVAAALPIAMIAPWPAQAGPDAAAPAQVMPLQAVVPATEAVPAGRAPATQTVTSTDRRSAALVGDADAADEPDPDPEPGHQGGNSERHGKQDGGDKDGAGKDGGNKDGGGKGNEPNPNCTLIVPPAPLTAQGLATPFELVSTNRHKGPCHEANDSQSAFVEATIVDPATGKLAIYRPLVVDRGTQPAAKPVVPTLPAGSVVGMWFGSGHHLDIGRRHGRLRQWVARLAVRAVRLLWRSGVLSGGERRDRGWQAEGPARRHGSRRPSLSYHA